VVGLTVDQMKPASGDASFRRYFRLESAGETRIAMDAPPEHEDCRPFVAIATMLRAAGVSAPAVLAQDLDQGFLLLEDLGETLYLDRLLASPDSAASLYTDAIAALVRMQVRLAEDASSLPPYDRALMSREMALFPDWLVGRHLATHAPVDLPAAYSDAAEALLEILAALPHTFVHRDYHSRNLMVLGHDGPGVLDFQDAVAGPASYDLVSLLKDCYIHWPREQVEAWVQEFHQAGSAEGLDLPPYDEFLREFDLMGVQRQLKAAGIFCRLNYRDGKSGYLADIPRTLGYIVDAGSRHPEIAALGRWIDSAVLPAIDVANDAVEGGD
jgi:aminoglycoside/choline kinase family phosphotransferase